MADEKEKGIASRLRDNLYLVQSLVLFISMVVGVTLYFHNAFATNERVDKLKQEIKETQADIKKENGKTKLRVEVVQSILCEMAIEQNLKSAVKICTRKENEVTN